MQSFEEICCVWNYFPREHNYSPLQSLVSLKANDAWARHPSMMVHVMYMLERHHGNGLPLGKASVVLLFTDEFSTDDKAKMTVLRRNIFRYSHGGRVNLQLFCLGLSSNTLRVIESAEPFTCSQERGSAIFCRRFLCMFARATFTYRFFCKLYILPYKVLPQQTRRRQPNVFRSTIVLCILIEKRVYFSYRSQMPSTV